MKKSICSVFICIALIIFLSVITFSLYAKYDSNRYRQLAQVLSSFSQALVDGDYDRAATFLEKYPDGKIPGRDRIVSLVDHMIYVAQKVHKHPEFTKFKRFRIESIYKNPESDGALTVERWNRFDAIVAFYSTEDLKDDSSVNMFFHLDKSGNEFKIRSCFPPLGFERPGKMRQSSLADASLQEHTTLSQMLTVELHSLCRAGEKSR